MRRITLPDDVTRWPAEALALWHERAAIMQHEGRVDRAEAERRAEGEVRATYGGRSW